MLMQLSVSTVMVFVTVIFHGFGLALLGRALRGEAQVERMHHIPALSLRTVFFTLCLVVAIFVLHGVEIWVYAALYLMIGAIPTLETSVYFSTISYAGIGFDDRYIDPAWRLVAAIEGINGFLLLGWSTAFFVALVSRLGRA
ncbi:two pore domain potassium channel family protein [Chakrabartia godavariana]|nr:two pore domain potassium channel family protein [Chakrabartia godavariana]